jgi:putative spermidine/putrescine transport system permease protein
MAENRNASHVSGQRPAGALLVRLLAAAVVLFLLSPIAIAVTIAFSSGDRLEFPIPGLSLRWFGVALTKSQYLEGLRASAIIGVANALLATIAGTGAAIALHRYRFPGKSILLALVMMPVALPAIVLGLGLLFSLPAYHMRPGLLAATLGHAVLGVPYVFAMVTAALSNYDMSLERASLNLGAGPFRTFLSITFPLIRDGVIAGGITSFLISFDNFSLSLFITRGDTLPLRLMQQLLSYADPSIAAISTVLIVLPLGGLLFLLPQAIRGRV